MCPKRIACVLLPSYPRLPQAVSKGMTVLTSSQVIDVDQEMRRVHVRCIAPAISPVEKEATADSEDGMGQEELWVPYDSLILAGHATDSQQ